MQIVLRNLKELHHYLSLEVKSELSAYGMLHFEFKSITYQLKRKAESPEISTECWSVWFHSQLSIVLVDVFVKGSNKKQTGKASKFRYRSNFVQQKWIRDEKTDANITLMWMYAYSFADQW